MPSCQCFLLFNLNSEQYMFCLMKQPYVDLEDTLQNVIWAEVWLLLFEHKDDFVHLSKSMPLWRMHAPYSAAFLLTGSDFTYCTTLKIFAIESAWQFLNSISLHIHFQLCLSWISYLCGEKKKRIKLWIDYACSTSITVKLWNQGFSVNFWSTSLQVSQRKEKCW